MTISIVPKDPLRLRPLLYEAWMFRETFKARSCLPDTVSRNAYWESFLLHTRNLMDFLEGKKKFPGDLTCTDFEDRNGSPVPAATIDDADEVREAINKHMSHITQKRLEERPDWRGLERFVTSIREKLCEFLDAVAPEYCPDQTLIQSIRDYLRGATVVTVV